MFKELLSRYTGQQIGVNWQEPTSFHAATLVSTNDQFFTVEIAKLGLTVHFPYTALLQIVEAPEGVRSGLFPKTFPALVQVDQLIVYEGALGFDIPL